jgi:hypothetical protein
MTVTTTRTNPCTWGPDTTTFGVSSMFSNYNRLQRTSQIETIYQSISDFDSLAVYINMTNTGWDTLKGVPYNRFGLCGSSAR